MTTMHYQSPGVNSIDFEDSIFVTSLDPKKTKEYQEYIESLGGIVKASVTRATNYLIYDDFYYYGKAPASYKKAMEMLQKKSSNIKIIKLSTFDKLIAIEKEQN